MDALAQAIFLCCDATCAFLPSKVGLQGPQRLVLSVNCERGGRKLCWLIAEQRFNMSKTPQSEGSLVVQHLKGATCSNCLFLALNMYFYYLQGTQHLFVVFLGIRCAVM